MNYIKVLLIILNYEFRILNQSEYSIEEIYKVICDPHNPCSVSDTMLNLINAIQKEWCSIPFPEVNEEDI